MTKHEAQMRFAVRAVQILSTEMAEGDFEAPEMAPALETYLDLIRYVSAHGMRMAGTISELNEMLDTASGFHSNAPIISEEAYDAVQHYLFELDVLYNQEGS